LGTCATRTRLMGCTHSRGVSDESRKPPYWLSCGAVRFVQLVSATRSCRSSLPLTTLNRVLTTKTNASEKWQPYARASSGALMKWVSGTWQPDVPAGEVWGVKMRLMMGVVMMCGAGIAATHAYIMNKSRKADGGVQAAKVGGLHSCTQGESFI
jgi:hypothetical protein